MDRKTRLREVWRASRRYHALRRETTEQATRVQLGDGLPSEERSLPAKLSELEQARQQLEERRAALSEVLEPGPEAELHAAATAEAHATEMFEARHDLATLEAIEDELKESRARSCSTVDYWREELLAWLEDDVVRVSNLLAVAKAQQPTGAARTERLSLLEARLRLIEAAAFGEKAADPRGACDRLVSVDESIVALLEEVKGVQHD